MSFFYWDECGTWTKMTFYTLGLQQWFTNKAHGDGSINNSEYKLLAYVQLMIHFVENATFPSDYET